MNDILKKILRYILIFFIFFFTSSFMTVVVYRFLPPPVTPLMLVRVVENLLHGKEVKLQKDWVPIEKISPNLVHAVLASEDQKFMYHSGFDWEAMQKAFEYNLKRRGGKKLRGGSTISQQVAKNVFLWPDRSVLRKVFEAYFTALIELIWPKKRIMEVYLNVIEMGNGIYGAEKASEVYFHHTADKLTRDEAAGIAAVLPNPRKYSPVKPNQFVYNRKPKILRDMAFFRNIKFN